MPRRPRILPALAATVAFLLAGIGAEDAGRVAAAPTSSAQAHYLYRAEAAKSRVGIWWDHKQHWYRDRRGSTRLATSWSVVHLFGVINALAIAHPTAGRRANVDSFARGAQRYWNANLRPVPGYAASPGTNNPHARTWFDDNGWWGIAFTDAYSATHEQRYLSYARRAMTFINWAGWDKKNGGIWWDTAHSFHAGESLATGTLLAATLYQDTHLKRYLRMANLYINWADADFRGPDGLYKRHERDITPMPYVQGPMAEAFVRLCHATGDHAYCDEGEELADKAAQRFPHLTMGPQYDAMYIRSLLQLYRLDGNRRWYDIAKRETDRAMRNARDPDGLYMRAWDGRSVTTVGTPHGKLQTHAATTSAIAWMAATPPPP